MDIAVLDLGATTFHLLCVRVWPDGSLVTIADEKAYVRFGARTLHAGHIDDIGWNRGLLAIGQLADRVRSLAPGAFVTVGTSALREAGNGGEFIDAVRRLCGIDIQLLSWEDQARAAYVGARSELPRSAGRIAVIDVGGGSIEIAVGDAAEPDAVYTLPLGVERLRDSFGARSLSDPMTMAAARDLVRMSAAPVLDQVRAMAPDRVVFASGTARAVHQLMRNLIPDESYLRSVVCETLGRALPTVLRSSRRDLLALGVRPARLDTIALSTVVLDAVTTQLGHTDLFVSRRGMREGVAVRALSRQDLDRVVEHNAGNDWHPGM